MQALVVKLLFLLTQMGFASIINKGSFAYFLLMR